MACFLYAEVCGARQDSRCLFWNSWAGWWGGSPRFAVPSPVCTPMHNEIVCGSLVLSCHRDPAVEKCEKNWAQATSKDAEKWCGVCVCVSVCVRGYFFPSPDCDTHTHTHAHTSVIIIITCNKPFCPVTLPASYMTPRETNRDKRQQC